MPVEWNGDSLTLAGPLRPNDFITKFRDLVQSGHQVINLEAHDLGSLYPNIDAPIAATISYYRNLGIEVTVTDTSGSLMLQSIINPLTDPAVSRVCSSIMNLHILS